MFCLYISTVKCFQKKGKTSCSGHMLNKVHCTSSSGGLKEGVLTSIQAAKYSRHVIHLKFNMSLYNAH